MGKRAPLKIVFGKSTLKNYAQFLSQLLTGEVPFQCGVGRNYLVRGNLTENKDVLEESALFRTYFFHLNQ